MYAASSVAMLRNARSRPILLAWFSLALGVGGPHSVRADDPAQDAHAPPSADRAEPPAVAAERELFSLEHFTLANGVEIVLDPMPGRSTAAVTVSVDRGTRDQRRGWTGLAHVTEHVLFGGTRDTPGDWNERIESLGRIDGNGVTTSDRTYYYDVVPSERLPELIWLEAERFAHGARDVDPSVVEHERAIVLREWSVRDRDVNSTVTPALVREALYPPDHPYALAVEHRGDIEAIGASEVQWFLQSAYRPERLTVAVSGGFEVERIRRALSEAFSPLRAAGVAALEERTEGCPRATRGERRILVDIRRPNDVLLVFWNVPSAGSEWTPALRALASTLGRRIRERLGAGADRAYVAYDDESDLCGLLEVHIEVPRDRGTANALGVLDTAIDEVTRQGLYDETERTRWLDGWLAREAIALSTPSSRAIRLSRRFREAEDGRYEPDQERALHRALTPERVREAAHQLLPRNARTVVSLSASARAPYAGRVVTDIVVDREATATGGGS